MIVTRNPSGAQVGRLLGIPAIFDTDDGRAVGIHYWSAAPFAHVITTPDCTEPPVHGTSPIRVAAVVLPAPELLHPDRGVLALHRPGSASTPRSGVK